MPCPSSSVVLVTLALYVYSSPYLPELWCDLSTGYLWHFILFNLFSRDSGRTCLFTYFYASTYFLSPAVLLYDYLGIFILQRFTHPGI